MTISTDHLDVLIVGAGLSGIGAAYYLQAHCPGKRYAILEGRATIGGTWDLFRYPGVRSDSDMYTLGYSFRPWREAKAIADGPSILAYIRETAAAYGIDRRIRFGHRVRRAEWSSAEARWSVEAERESGEVVRLTCGFLYMCSGYYDYERGYAPDWPGSEQFAGQIVHPQQWPAQLDYAGKRVVVIGSGATAVTLVPTLAERAAHVTMLQRSPSYVVAQPGRDAVADWLRDRLPEGLAHRLARWKNVLLGLGYYTLLRAQPKLAKRSLIKLVREQLGPDYDVDTHFTPRYNPWDQRLCLVPDGDLFGAIRSGTASVVTDQIDTFTPAGIRLRSGEELEADIIVTATGLIMKLMSGVELIVDGRTVALSQTMNYKGMMFSDIPNLAASIGYTNASWTLKCELIARYVTRLLRYMDRHGYVQCTPRQNDPSIAKEPVVNFTSGYVQRALPSLPHQGSRWPWKLYQNYLRDTLAYRFGKVDDGALEFRRRAPSATNPAPGGKKNTMRLINRTAVVTGAASGIGRALAVALARRGCHLALADIDQAGLRRTAELVAAPELRVSWHPLDVSDAEAVGRFPDVVLAHHPGVDLLFNNAGVALGGTFEQVSDTDFEWLFGINFRGVVRMTRAFLPLLKASDDARIVNVSSVYGLMGPSGQTAYAASKFAVRGFSEALRHELEGSPVGVTVVHPGGVATAIADNARVSAGISAEEAARGRAVARTLLKLAPEVAGETIVRGVERRQTRVLVGRDARVIALLVRIAPVAYWRLLKRLLPR